MRRTHLIGAALFVTATAVFGPLCFSEFTWYDDPGTVHHNPSLNPPTLAKVGQYWTHLGSRAPLGLYIPLTYTAWAGVAALAYVEQPDASGIHLNPWMFHTANVLLHSTAAVVVFAILRRVLQHDWAALTGALLFALHPVQVEAVGWVSGMKDVLCGLLGLIAVWQYVLFAAHGPAKHKLHYALGTVAFIGAMLSKPAAVVVPLVALAIDVLILRRRARAALASLAPWFILMIPCIIWTKAAQPGTDVPAVPMWARPIIALDSLAFYLGKLVAPIGLTVDYGRTPVWVHTSNAWWFTWLVPASVTFLVWLLRKRHPELLAAGGIFVVGLLPVLGFLPFLFQHFSGVGDHYLYLSMLGVALAASVLVRRYPNRLTAVAASLVLVLLAVLTVRQSRVWHDDLALWSHNVKVNPQSSLAQLNLGSAYFRAGDLSRAESCYREAIRINPDDDAAHDNLAMVLIRTGRREEAMQHTNQVLEINRSKSRVRP
jgi:hypothetical protein